MNRTHSELSWASKHSPNWQFLRSTTPPMINPTQFQDYTQLGRQHEIGDNGHTKDCRLAFYYYNDGAKRQDPECMFNIGRCYLYGIGCSANIDMAFSWLDLAVKNNSQNARILIEFLYSAISHSNYDKEVTRELQKDSCVFKDHFEFGGQAEYQRGVQFLTGTGVARNEKEAIKLFKQAIDLKCPDASAALGLCHLLKIGGLAFDHNTVDQLFTQGADLGSGVAADFLVKWQNGQHKSIDPFSARTWFDIFSAERYGDAFFELSDQSPQITERSLRYMWESARHRRIDATYQLAIIYLETSKSYAAGTAKFQEMIDNAAHWFRKACEWNVSLAFLPYGYLIEVGYFKGQPEQPDAVYWRGYQSTGCEKCAYMFHLYCQRNRIAVDPDAMSKLAKYAKEGGITCLSKAVSPDFRQFHQPPKFGNRQQKRRRVNRIKANAPHKDIDWAPEPKTQDMYRPQHQHPQPQVIVEATSNSP